MAASVLFDLDHTGEIRKQLDGATQIVQVVQRPRGVFGHELDVVPGASLPDELGDCWPRTEQMRTQAGLALVEKLTQAIVSHSPRYLARRVTP